MFGQSVFNFFIFCVLYKRGLTWEIEKQKNILMTIVFVTVVFFSSSIFQNFCSNHAQKFCELVSNTEFIISSKIRQFDRYTHKKPKSATQNCFLLRLSLFVSLSSLSVMIYRGDMPSGDDANAASGESSCLKEVRNVVASTATGVHNASSSCSSSSKKYP